MTTFDLDRQIAKITYDHTSITIELNVEYLSTLPQEIAEKIYLHEALHLREALRNMVEKYKRSEKGYMVKLPTIDS